MAACRETLTTSEENRGRRWKNERCLACREPGQRMKMSGRRSWRRNWRDNEAIDGRSRETWSMRKLLYSLYASLYLPCSAAYIYQKDSRRKA